MMEGDLEEDSECLFGDEFESWVECSRCYVLIPYEGYLHHCPVVDHDDEYYVDDEDLLYMMYTHSNDLLDMNYVILILELNNCTAPAA